MVLKYIEFFILLIRHACRLVTKLTMPDNLNNGNYTACNYVDPLQSHKGPIDWTKVLLTMDCLDTHACLIARLPLYPSDQFSHILNFVYIVNLFHINVISTMTQIWQHKVGLSWVLSPVDIYSGYTNQLNSLHGNSRWVYEDSNNILA